MKLRGWENIEKPTVCELLEFKRAGDNFLLGRSYVQGEWDEALDTWTGCVRIRTTHQRIDRPCQEDRMSALFLMHTA